MLKKRLPLYQKKTMFDWKFKPKLYPHFDRLFNKRETKNLIINPKSIASHSFLPFIEKEQKNRRFRKYLEAKKSQENQCKKPYTKTRPIKYASHIDAQIYSYYRCLLNEKYEEKLKQYDLLDNVIAYRKIPVKNGQEQGKCNIHFAKEAFNAVINMQSCIALTFDISGFFESLSHSFLKIKLKEVLDVEDLPPDYKAVFKALTQYSVVDFNDVYKALDLLKIKNGSLKYNECPRYIFRKKKTLCSKQDYRKKIVSQNLVKKNTYQGQTIPQGIPQGSALSDVLANIYMLDFDKEMRALEKQINGYYRRYSDDILWICRSEKEKEQIETKINDSIKTLFGNTLKLSSEKSTTTKFTKISSSLVSEGHKFQYLGFRFDGKKAFFRDSTISRYKRNTTNKIKKFVKIYNNKYKKLNNPKPLKNFINRSKIFHEVYYRNKNDNSNKQDNKVNKKNNHGNFITYFERAKKIFNHDKKRKYSLYENQLSNNKKWIHSKIDEEVKKYSPN